MSTVGQTENTLNYNSLHSTGSTLQTKVCSNVSYKMHHKISISIENLPKFTRRRISLSVSTPRRLRSFARPLNDMLSKLNSIKWETTAKVGQLLTSLASEGRHLSPSSVYYNYLCTHLCTNFAQSVICYKCVRQQLNKYVLVKY